MKTIVHKATDRGFTEIDWLHSKHSFSFSSYYDPSRIHFGMLRVLNDDIVDPGKGFDTHPHQDMEIVTIPLSGILQHTDSTGNFSLIHPGEVQVMTAGTGIFHSEYNHSLTENVCFLQIWVFPDKKGLTPRYDQRTFAPELFQNQLYTVVSPLSDSDCLAVHQDAYFSIGNFMEGKEITYQIHNPNNGIYLFIIEGKAVCCDVSLEKRDAIGISDKTEISINIEKNSSILLIEVPIN
jgi:quercetin 2,3-dioxygenase